MISLYDSNITDILPETLSKKPEVQALGYAINKAMKRLIDYCGNIGIYSSIDTVPENVLDLLAVELNTQYYDDSLDVDIKRNLINNTLVWYMNTGTPAAIEELVRAVFGEGEVKEWFEYGGTPYCFRIATSNINTTDEMIQTITAMINAIQNVRSHLESVVVEVLEQMQTYGGCVIEVMADTVTIGIDMNI